MAERLRAIACSCCDVLTRADCLEDCNDLAPLLGLCCEQCADEAVRERHDEDYDYVCTCSRCDRARARADRLRRAAEARVLGGFSATGLRLVGLEGVDDELVG